MCHKFKCRDMKLTYLNTLFRGAWDFTPVVCIQKIRNKAKIYFLKPWSQGGALDFKRWGWLKQWGFEIFDSWNFGMGNLARTIFLEGWLDLSRGFCGYPKQSEDFVITLFGMVNIQTQTLNL